MKRRPLSEDTLLLAAEALQFWMVNLDGDEDPGFPAELQQAWQEIHDKVAVVGTYRVNFGEGDVYFDDLIDDMETEDNLVYVAAGRGFTIVQISGCLRGDHADVIDDMRDRYGPDVVIDGPWFPFDRRMKEVILSDR